MSSSSSPEPRVHFDPTTPPEPDAFTPEEFGAWRGLLRVHTTVFRELDRRLRADHRFGIDAYGVLVTLVNSPNGTLTIGQLGDRRHLTPSGITRSVDRLATRGLVQRSTNPADGRSLLVGLTGEGFARLRSAQVTHHAVVRELLFAGLEEPDVRRLSELWEKAMPGSVSSRIWPPEVDKTRAEHRPTTNGEAFAPGQ